MGYMKDLLIGIKETEYSLDTQRYRVISRWSVDQDTDGSWRLKGVILQDSEKSFEDTLMRYTRTSPIYRYKNNVVFTQSGSEYYLHGPPLDEQALEILKQFE